MWCTRTRNEPDDELCEDYIPENNKSRECREVPRVGQQRFHVVEHITGRTNGQEMGVGHCEELPGA